MWGAIMLGIAEVNDIVDGIDVMPTELTIELGIASPGDESLSDPSSFSSFSRSSSCEGSGCWPSC
jgi:hypothetical protein